MSRSMVVKGKVVWVSGPAVKADGMAASKMYETVEVGEAKDGRRNYSSYRRRCVCSSLRVYLRVLDQENQFTVLVCRFRCLWAPE